MSASDQSFMGNVTLAILAGGAGSRMGTPKASLSIRGRPILEHLLDQIAWRGPTMLVTAPGREHPPGAQRFDWEVQDPPGGGGPLRGILTALEHIRTPLLAVMPVDMPEIRAAQFQFLIRELNNRQNCRGVFLRRSIQNGSQVEPFPSIFRQAAVDLVRERLIAGQGSVKRLSSASPFELIESPSDWPPRIWTNLNSPADLASYAASDSPSGV